MIKDRDAFAPEVLAAKLVARALHDIAGPTSGLTAALDVLGDTDSRDLHAEALTLARDSLAQMATRIAFCRAAFGGGGGLEEDAFDVLAQSPFAGSRARLDVSAVEHGAPRLVLQSALILLQISAESLASGGLARLTITLDQGNWRARVDGAGARTLIAPETLAGLEGLGPGSGLPGRWAPGRYLYALAASAGGSLDLSVQDGQFCVTLTCPA